MQWTLTEEQESFSETLRAWLASTAPTDRVRSWIDDGDLTSKRSFAQLMQLFTMADTGGRENQPLLTIPTR